MKKVVKKKTSNKTKIVNKKLDRKGFTLIELLAVIAVLALVFSVAMYSVTSIVKAAKTKTYVTTRNEIEKAAGNFSLENSDEIFFVPSESNDIEYQCVSVKDLIDYGFLDNNVTKSHVSEDETVSVDSYVYLERDTKSKSVTKMNYVSAEGSVNMCANTVIASGKIRFTVIPDNKWTHEKDVTIKYTLSGLAKSSDKNDYVNLYSTDGSNWNEANSKQTLTVTTNTQIQAQIKNVPEDRVIVSENRSITMFDFDGPQIELVDSTTETKYVKGSTTVGIKISDCSREGTDCSGIDDITDNTVLKNQIVDGGKLKVYVNNKEVTNIKLTHATGNSKGRYNIKITTDENGPVKIEFFPGAFSDKTYDQKNYNSYTPLEPKIIFDNTPLQIDVQNSSEPLSEKQIVKLTCRDNNPGITYYYGKTAPTSSTVFRSDLDSVLDTSYNNKYKLSIDNIEVTSAGTYYFACRDASNNMSKVSVQYFKYTVNSYLNSITGTEGTYNTSNYDQVNVGNYLGVKDMELSFIELLNTNNVGKQFIKNPGSSLEKYKGYSINTSAGATAVLLDGLVKLTENNVTYSLWFNRNKVKISFNVNGGELASTSQLLSLDDDGTVLKNDKVLYQTIKYGGTLSSTGLYNYCNEEFINILKSGSLGVSNNQWKCYSGCTTSNATFSHAGTQYAASDFCDASTSDCTVKLKVNWEEIKYGISLDYKYGACRFYNNTDKNNKDTVTNIGYSQEFTLGNPCKKIKYKGNVNSTQNNDCKNPSVSSTEYSFKFDGWSINGNKSFNTETKYSKLTEKNNDTVSFVANWSLDPSVQIKLPTVTKSGCKCYWSLENNVTNTYDYNSGQTITKGINPNAEANNGGYIVVNLYSVCFKEDIDADRCYYNTENKNDANNGNLYHITTCQGDNDKPCSYNQKNNSPASGTVLRKWLNSEKSDNYNKCKYTVTYNCTENGGTTKNSTASYNYATSPDLSKKCTKSGWTFVGWNTNKNAHNAISASSLEKKTQTLYAIYKKQIRTMFYGENYGLSTPSGIKLSNYSNVTFACVKDDKSCTSKCQKCSSTCMLYNKDTKCTAISPDIVKSSKTFFSVSKADYEEYNASTHIKENTVFSSPDVTDGIKYYFVPHDRINGIRYKCDVYHDGDGKWRSRLDIFNITICDGKTCNYNSLNGISKSSTVERSQLHFDPDDACKAEYYSSSDLRCNSGASSSLTKKATVSGCKKLSLYRTTTKVTSNGANSWYYVPAQKCYIDGSSLQSSKPSSCSSGSSSSSSSSSGSGSYHVTICSDGGFLTSTMSYGCNTVYYSSIKYLQPYLRETFYRAGCYASSAGGYTSYLDASDNGKTLNVGWTCGGNSGACYSCTNRLGSYQWYTRTPSNECVSQIKVGNGNCTK